MYQQKRCKSCMYGTIVGGVCNHCGRQEKKPADRRVDALPLDYRLIGRYLIGDVLGRGGFGITYAAWDQKENRRVAIKELLPTNDVIRQPDGHTVVVRKGQEQYFAKVAECFCNEAQLLIQLQDVKGIVEVYQLFEANGTVYYVMEYLDGHDFKTQLQNHGCYSWQELAPIIQPVIGALEQLHTYNLIHRDISPDNIFLTRSGDVRLIDFGSVRTYQGNHSFTVYVKQNFSPLEQWQSHGEQGPHTDVYALCVTMYYALSGQLPPKAADRALNRPIRPLQEMCPHVPAQVAAAIHKGMGLHPHERYQSMRELDNALFVQKQQSWVPQIFQGKKAQQNQKQPPKSKALSEARLVCMQGVHKGKQWPLKRGVALRIGRQPACEVAYPLNSPGISGFQCTVLVDQQGQLWVRDDNSRYGTRLGQNTLKPQTWYPVSRGATLCFGQEYYVIQ